VWWAGSRPVDVYLGTRAVVVCRGAEVSVKASVAGFDAAMEAASVHLRQDRSRQRLRVWLSGGLCQPFMVPLIAGVESRVEIQKIAATVAPVRTGLGDDCQVWADSRKSAMGTLAVAMQKSRVARVLEQFAQHGRVVSLRPWWAEVLRARLAMPQPPGAVGVQDCDSLTVLAGVAGGFDAASVITPLFDQQSADAAWARALLSGDAQPLTSWHARLVIEDRAATSFDGCTFGSLVDVAP